MLKPKFVSLGKKLRLAFISIMGITIFVAILFSVFYFTGKMRNEAVKNMRKNIDVVNLIFRSKKNEVGSFARRLSNDRTIQILLDFQIRNKLSGYTKKIVESNPEYTITLLDRNFGALTFVGIEDSSLVKYNPLNENNLITSFRDGKEKVLTGIELIKTREKEDILSISSCRSLYRNGKFIGLVVVRYIFNDNIKMLYEIKDLLRVSAAIFESNRIIASVGEKVRINKKIYDEALTKQKKYYEITNLSPNGVLLQYLPLNDFMGQAVGVVGISVSSKFYMKIIIEAVVTFFIIMIVLLIITVILANGISRGITDPVNNLLSGARRITTGDLSHEVKAELLDEVGQLSIAFNEMRLSLNEKMTTIESMNINLENTVKLRTKTIEDMLGKMQKYLSPQLYEAIIGGKRSADSTKHHRKKLTVFFSDVAGFTSTTESLQPEEISYLLNSYLNQMANIALKWGGTIDKFVGDAVMVFYGDPEFTNDKDHALRAAKMAIEMRDSMVLLRKQWEKEGFNKTFHVRAGIHTGYCTIGNFGSENRMDYTVIGNTVNLASRLESAAKADTVLISPDTYNLIKSEILCKKCLKISAKGFEQKIDTFEIVRERKLSLNTVDCIDFENNVIAFKQNAMNIDNLSTSQRNYLINKIIGALRWLKSRKAVPNSSSDKDEDREDNNG